MLRSMTGYGRAEARINDKNVVVEVRSVNHRYLDVSVRIPRLFFVIEKDIKKLVSSYTSRGKIDVTVQFDTTQQNDTAIQVNLPQVQHIYGLLESIKTQVSMPDEVGFGELLAFKDYIFKPEEDEVDEATMWQSFQEGLTRALEEMKQMQEVEGEEIAVDMLQRLKEVESLAGTIEQCIPDSVANRQQNLKERVKSLNEGLEVDEIRMMQEVAVLADKSDITEEVVRAKSHIKQFMTWINSAETIGRKLDFLIQEINREINTIGAKASDADISLHVVEIKNELEKIREQVQNIM